MDLSQHFKNQKSGWYLSTTPKEFDERRTLTLEWADSARVDPPERLLIGRYDGDCLENADKAWDAIEKTATQMGFAFRPNKELCSDASELLFELEGDPTQFKPQEFVNRVSERYYGE